MRPLSPLILTKAQQSTQEAIARSRQQPHSLVQRARIILNAGAGCHNKATAKELKIKEETVGLWRRRWLSAKEALATCEDDPERLRRQTFSAEQVCQILALACAEPPPPLTHWTRQDLAREAINRGIVDRISATSIGRFLNAGSAQTASDALLAESKHRR